MISDPIAGGLVLVAAYLIGGIPFGYLLVKWKTGGDVRASGSRNIGATNVFRTTGRALAIATLLLDIAKGFCAVWLAARLTGGAPVWLGAAAVAVMLGHIFPLFLRFHGGKAVASYVGAFLYLSPLPLALLLVLFILIVVRTKFVSLASITGAALLPLLLWLVQHPPLPLVLASVVAGGLVIWRHKENIARLRAGKENAFSFGAGR